MSGPSTPARLCAAAALCAVPFGLVWSVTSTQGTTLYGDCGYSDGPYCTGNGYIPGSTSVTLVSQSPLRVFLFSAIAIFLATAVLRRTDTTRRLARLACAAVGLAAVLAAAGGARLTLLCLLGALAFVVPLVLPVPPSRRFGVTRNRQVQ